MELPRMQAQDHVLIERAQKPSLHRDLTRSGNLDRVISVVSCKMGMGIPVVNKIRTEKGFFMPEIPEEE